MIRTTATAPFWNPAHSFLASSSKQRKEWNTCFWVRQQLLTLQELSGNQELLPPQKREPAGVLWKRSCNASGTIPPTLPSPSFCPHCAWWHPKRINRTWQCEDWTPPLRAVVPVHRHAEAGRAVHRRVQVVPPQRPLCMTQLPESAEGLCCLLLWRLINLRKYRCFPHFYDSSMSLTAQVPCLSLFLCKIHTL